jgi:hypothetical protein
MQGQHPFRHYLASQSFNQLFNLFVCIAYPNSIFLFTTASQLHYIFSCRRTIFTKNNQ